MAGCEETTHRLQWHVLHDHAPGIFNEDIIPSDEVSNQRYAALSVLAKALNGPNARVKDLVALLNKFELIGAVGNPGEPGYSDEADVLSNELAAARSILVNTSQLTSLLDSLKSPHSSVTEPLAECERRPPGTFSEPQSEDASAPVGEQDVHRESSPRPPGNFLRTTVGCCIGEQDVDQQSSPEPAPRRLAFDSHFHLDHLQWSLELPLDTSIRRTMATVGNIPEKHQISLAGWAAVFCDLPTHQTPERIDELAMDSISVATRVHKDPVRGGVLVHFNL